MITIGEAGSVTTGSPTTNQPIAVTLANPLTNPVFALTSTNNGGDPFALRVVSTTTNLDGDTTSFSFIIEEWEYLDGPHPAVETINWLAIEAGLHSLPDGRTIEAGTAIANHTTTAVTLTGSFGGNPVVLTSVMSNNGGDTVDSDPFNITSTGFDVSLQEEEAEGPHTTETVGWIAVQSGGSAEAGTAAVFSGVDENTDILPLGDTFINGIPLAETQTINGGDTATTIIDGQTSTTVGVAIREEQSSDTELNHIDEDVGVVVFESGNIACFANGTHLRTPDGDKPVETLKVGEHLCLHKDHTDTGQSAPILRIFKRYLGAHTLAKNEKLAPVRIRAGALGCNLPKRDLLVSQQHRMLVCSKIASRMFGHAKVLVPAIKLIQLPGIDVDTSLSDITYYHVLMEKHQVLFAEDAPSESFLTGPEALKTLSAEAQAEINALFKVKQHALETSRSAYPLPRRKHQKKLVARHLKNRKPLLESYEGAGKRVYLTATCR